MFEPSMNDTCDRDTKRRKGVSNKTGLKSIQIVCRWKNKYFCESPQTDSSNSLNLDFWNVKP